MRHFWLFFSTLCPTSSGRRSRALVVFELCLHSYFSSLHSLCWCSTFLAYQIAAWAVGRSLAGILQINYMHCTMFCTNTNPPTCFENYSEKSQNEWLYFAWNPKLFVVLCKLIKNLTRPPQCFLAWQGKCSWLEWWAWQHSQSTGWCIGRHSSIEICSREQKWIATEWRKNVGRSVFGSAEKPRKRSESRRD